ncbi:MAG: DNA polymerase III subunit epsilon, partial [Rhizobiales bacterium]|nr:DNA polymerase III subunit epsilon [Hyphomicrobiales bacterium]
MREIVLDTETTGLDPFDGHRIVEIGALELHNHLPTGRTYHQYINPERDMPPEAFAVHGLSETFLGDKPVFAEIAGDFLTFVDGAPLVIHNASFDMKFINAELKWAGKSALPPEQAIDSLALARKKHPMGPNSLDALCKRYNVDNAMRDLHGALLDSELLAQVYLELIGGRQQSLTLVDLKGGNEGENIQATAVRPRPKPLAPRLSQAE